jgi:hypothetical protein
MKINGSEILNKINSELHNAPDEISVNAILTGESAKKYFIMKTILASIAPEFDEEDVCKYIIRSGIEREFDKISNVWKNV